VQSRPSHDVIQSIRATLQQLEVNFPSLEDQPHLAELKRILLLRMADIEFVEAVVHREAATEDARKTAERSELKTPNSSDAA
jgi:hypothetical protein